MKNIDLPRLEDIDVAVFYKMLWLHGDLEPYDFSLNMQPKHISVDQVIKKCKINNNEHNFSTIQKLFEVLDDLGLGEAHGYSRVTSNGPGVVGVILPFATHLRMTKDVEELNIIYGR